MELKILNKEHQPLLSRTKIESEILFEKSTPSGADVKTSLAKNIGKDEGLLVIKGIYTLYGMRKAKVLSYVYDNKESIKKIEKVKEDKKGDKKEEQPKAEKTEQKAKEQPGKKAQEPQKKEEQPKAEKTEQKAKEQPGKKQQSSEKQ